MESRIGKCYCLFVSLLPSKSFNSIIFNVCVEIIPQDPSVRHLSFSFHGSLQLRYPEALAMYASPCECQRQIEDYLFARLT